MHHGNVKSPLEHHSLGRLMVHSFLIAWGPDSQGNRVIELKIRRGLNYVVGSVRGEVCLRWLKLADGNGGVKEHCMGSRPGIPTASKARA